MKIKLFERKYEKYKNNIYIYNIFFVGLRKARANMHKGDVEKYGYFHTTVQATALAEIQENLIMQKIQSAAG